MLRHSYDEYELPYLCTCLYSGTVLTAMRGLDLCPGCCCASLSSGVCRTSGGDKVEAFLCGPGDAVLPIAAKDLGNGCYVLSGTADKPGTWTIKPRVRHTSKCNPERS